MSKKQGKGKWVHVIVCVPSLGTWCSDFGKSLVLLFTYFTQNKVPGAFGQRLSIISGESSMLSQSRESMAKMALRTEGCTHILFLDTDMVFPRDLLNRLVAHKKPVVGCNCTTRVSPIMPVAHDLQGNRIASIGRTGLEEVQQTGMAVMLISTDVLKRLRPPLFLMEWVPEYNAYCGEDIYFSAKVQETGEKVYVDHDLSREVGHIGTRVCRHEMIESMGETK